MRTERLFYKDSHQTTCQAKVLACREVKKGYEILLDQTVFYPEGGGQPCDIGTMNRVEVMDVQEKDGEIWHRTREAIQEGTEVTCRIDWERRFDLKQQHSGGGGCRLGAALRPDAAALRRTSDQRTDP